MRRIKQEVLLSRRYEHRLYVYAVRSDAWSAGIWADWRGLYGVHVTPA